MLPATVFGMMALGALRRAEQVWPQSADLTPQGVLQQLLAIGHGLFSVAFVTLLTVLFLVRRPPVGHRARPIPMLTAIAGTFIMTVALVQPVTIHEWWALAVADVAMMLGLGFAMYALNSLRVCFGIAPEARGLVTGGAYGLVRHPVYVGEFIAFLGALLPVLSPFTAIIFVVFCLLQVRRAVLEESVLLATFPEYAAYQQRTPAVLPYPSVRG